MYRKKWISETDYIIQQRTSRGFWRNADEQSIGYVNWLAEGNVQEEVAYTPPLPPEPPTLESLIESKKREIAEAWRNDIVNVGMTIEHGEDTFTIDYGIEDALIWEHALNYVDPEATHVEARQIDNTFVAIPKELFMTVPALQKAYYASQLQRKWALQKQADSAQVAADLDVIVWE